MDSAWSPHIQSTANPSAYEWNTTWGGANSEYCRDLEVDSADDIYIAGHTNSFTEDVAMCLLKYSKQGILLWEEIFEIVDYTKAFAVTTDSLNNVYLAGSVYNSYGNQPCIVKYNSSGGYQWHKIWGNPIIGFVYDITIDSSFNIYTVGEYGDPDAQSTYTTLIKFNSSGHHVWNATWDTTARDWGDSLVIDSTGNIYISGTTGTPHTATFLAKYNSLGYQVWNRTIPYEYLMPWTDLALDSSENIYLVGDSILKYNSDGQQQWNVTGNLITGVAINQNDNVYVSIAFGGHGEVWRFDTDGNLDWSYGHTSGQSIAIDSMDTLYFGSTKDYDLVLKKMNPRPWITVYSPYEQEFFGETPPTFNISVDEPDLESVWYSFDDGPNITITELSGQIDQEDWDANDRVIMYLRFYANNSYGYTGVSEILIRRYVPVTSSTTTTTTSLTTNNETTPEGDLTMPIIMISVVGVAVVVIALLARRYQSKP